MIPEQQPEPAQHLDSGLAQRMLFLAPGVVHSLGNALFAVQGHAQMIGSRGPDARKEREAILKANEQAQTSLWFLRLLLGDPGAVAQTQAGILLRRVGEVLRVPCRNRGLTVYVEHTSRETPVLIAGARLIEGVTAMVSGLMEALPIGFDGGIELDLVTQDSDGATVSVRLRPASAMLPFPVEAEALCTYLHAALPEGTLEASPLQDGVAARFPVAHPPH